MFKDNLSEDQQREITKLIETIRETLQSENFDILKAQVEDLKTKMKEIVATQAQSNSDSMSDLNDL
nr:hypothetical protein DMDDKFKA_00158 [Haslea ostrearia]